MYGFFSLPQSGPPGCVQADNEYGLHHFDDDSVSLGLVWENAMETLERWLVWFGVLLIEHESASLTWILI